MMATASLIALLLGVSDGAAARRAPAPVTVEVRAERDEARSWKLVVTLRNQGREPIRMYRSDLPWGNRASMLIAAAVLDAFGEPLEPAYFIDDPVPNEIEIGSGRIETGTLTLEDRFPTLRQTLESREVVVFWSYRPKQSSGELGDRLGGWVVLTKNTK